MGAIGNERYFTERPPEKVPGFLDTVIDEINQNLSPKPIRWPWFRWSVNRAIRRVMRQSDGKAS